MLSLELKKSGYLLFSWMPFIVFSPWLRKCNECQTLLIPNMVSCLQERLFNKLTASVIYLFQGRNIDSSYLLQLWLILNIITFSLTTGEECQQCYTFIEITLWIQQKSSIPNGWVQNFRNFFLSSDNIFGTHYMLRFL